MGGHSPHFRPDFRSFQASPLSLVFLCGKCFTKNNNHATRNTLPHFSLSNPTSCLNLTPMMNIYCEGNFDLFHAGHLRWLEALASTSEDAKLIVGVLSTDDAKSRGYQDPTWSLDQRASLIRSLKCVARVVSPAPAILTEDFLKELKVCSVYQAFEPANVSTEQTNKLYAAPKAMGIFHTKLGTNPDYHVSTAPTIQKAHGWSDVWERKAKVQDKTNTRVLTGYDETDFDPESFSKRWQSAVKYLDGETVLGVGCGAGFLGDFLPGQGYVGVEKSQSQANIFIARSGRCVISQDAQVLPFKDGAFDHVISHSMLEYMPGKEAALHAIREMM